MKQDITLETLHISHSSLPDVDGKIDKATLSLTMIQPNFAMETVNSNGYFTRLCEGEKVVDAVLEGMLTARWHLITRTVRCRFE